MVYIFSIPSANYFLHISPENIEMDFFIKGWYNGPGTFVGPSRDLPDSFHEILFIFVRLVVLIIFDTFRTNI